MALETLDRPGDFIAGEFVVPDAPDAELRILSPGDQADVVGVHPVSVAHVDRAVAAARGAFPAWRRTPESERVALIRRYQTAVRAHEDAIAETISREVGKPLWDARTEAKALAGKVELVLGPGADWTKTRFFDELPGELRYRPHGVMAVIGPFNFPAHLPNGQILPALLLGNTVVFKPSDRTPNAAVWMARCFEEAGFPPGVVNVVQGGVPTAEALTGHDDIDGILFTGSVEVGKKIVAANADRPGRIVALELGGKNATIVLDDADLERTVRQLAFAAYATAGQRCTATSRIYATPGIAGRIVERFAEVARSVPVGYPLDPGIFMGPLITEAARERLLAAQARARAAGFEAVVDGGVHEVEGRRGWYVRPSVHRAPSATVRVDGYTHDELFGPDVAVYEVEDLDQAIELANGTRYGLAAAVFTSSRDSFDVAADELRVGVLHWNRSSAGASGKLPFGGVRDSGNHRPAGIHAGLSCAYPQAVLLSPPADAPLPSWPGLFDD